MTISEDGENDLYSYRYSVHRAGVFYRWEDPSDGPAEESNMDITTTATDKPTDDNNMEVEQSTVDDTSNSKHDVSMMEDEDKDTNIQYHNLPLRLLSPDEEYIVNDVLGVTNPAHPDVEHIRVPHASDAGFGDMKLLHSKGRQDSFSSKVKSGTSLSSMGREGSKKRVGFAPEPPSYHDTHHNNHSPGGSGFKSNTFGSKKEPVHLDSTDGLIVASMFLPVHLHRSDDGAWTADWDYEALLSMQTHLRVTRVGVVKWRGWHGNKGADGSPEGGIPVAERHLVEECLRPFSCVPVWAEPSQVGEM